MGKRVLVLLLLTWALSAAMPAAGMLTEAVAEQSGTFTGTWIASGERRPFDFVEGREVGTFDVQGHVNLRAELGQAKDYWGECVGLYDSVEGGSARCVWRSMEGDKAYVVLKGQPLKKGTQISGAFVGGTGKLKGIEGTLTFTWSTVFRNEDKNLFTGQTLDIRGAYQLP